MEKKKSLQDVITQNHKEAYDLYLEKQKAKMKQIEKEQIKQSIIVYFTIIFIIAISSLYILSTCKQNKSVEQLNKGFNTEYFID